MKTKNILSAVLFSLAAIALAALPAHAQVKVKMLGGASCPGGALHCAALSWTAPATGPSPTSYNVYRTTTNGACATNPSTAPGCALAGSTTAPTVAFTDNNLAASTTYFWVVTAVDASGESPTSNQATGTTGADPVPNAPTGLTVTAQ